MKKRVIIIFLIIIALLIGGGIIILKLVSNKEKVNSSNQQQNNLPPLNELNDQELEKCLLEDFSRRLDLKKYFVFSLGELTKEKLRDNFEAYGNGRIAKNSLARDLSKLSNEHGMGRKKSIV